MSRRIARNYRVCGDLRPVISYDLEEDCWRLVIYVAGELHSEKLARRFADCVLQALKEAGLTTVEAVDDDDE